MQPTATPQTHKTLDIETAIRHTVPWRVTAVGVIADARLRVTFVDETTGDVDLGAFLSDVKINGTVFDALRDPAIFSQAQVVLGAVQWPNGADLAPDAMYDAIRERGVWVVE